MELLLYTVCYTDSQKNEIKHLLMIGWLVPIPTVLKMLASLDTINVPLPPLNSSIQPVTFS